jgi:LPS export ABC transporter protein LptC
VKRSTKLMVCSLTTSGLALATLTGCMRRDVNESATFESTDIGYSASGIELIQTDAEGRTRYRLTASELSQDPRSREMRLASVDLQMKTRDSAWQATARSATLSADARKLAFRDQVLLESSGQPALRLRTDVLDYDFLTRRARSPGSAHISFEAGELTANRIDVDLERQRLSLGSSVHGRFAP